MGGFRRKSEMEEAIKSGKTDLVSLSRPLICEPDFINKLMQAEDDYASNCRNCNECVFMCDSGRPTACYSAEATETKEAAL